VEQRLKLKLKRAIKQGGLEWKEVVAKRHVKYNSVKLFLLHRLMAILICSGMHGTANTANQCR
jgi:hypothetical protein